MKAQNKMFDNRATQQETFTVEGALFGRRTVRYLPGVSPAAWNLAQDPRLLANKTTTAQ
jgi:hypothetical protein